MATACGDSPAGAAGKEASDRLSGAQEATQGLLAGESAWVGFGMAVMVAPISKVKKRLSTG